MSWLELHLQLPEKLVEQAEETLLGLGALSVTLADNADEPILEPDPGTQPIWSKTRVVGLFQAAIDPDLVLSLVHQQMPQDFFPAEWHHLDERVWEREWLKYFQPIKITENFWVSTKPVDQPYVTTLLLDPGLAFGTGTHPTTALCLEWLARQNFASKEVIDFGCGSGILAITALLRNAAKTYCVDIDPQALTATENNMRRNNMGPRRFELSQALNSLIKPSDVLVANILAGPLVKFSADIATQVVTGGSICLSGILEDQVQQVSDAFATHFTDLQICHREEWVRICGIRKASGEK